MTWKSSIKWFLLAGLGGWLGTASGTNAPPSNIASGTTLPLTTNQTYNFTFSFYDINSPASCGPDGWVIQRASIYDSNVTIVNINAGPYPCPLVVYTSPNTSTNVINPSLGPNPTLVPGTNGVGVAVFQILPSNQEIYVAGATNSYTDTGLTSGVYVYQVAVLNGTCAQSQFSAPITVIVP